MVDWNTVLAAAPTVRLAGTLQRLVESQEQVATNQLVSSLARQSQLEVMLEATKPALRPGSQSLHYLLATPFRYPPLKHGSRFGKKNEPSLFYGSLQTRTVLAEAAYYRFIFWYGMAVPPAGKLDTQHTLFGVNYKTDHGLQLQSDVFAGYTELLCAPANYSQTQSLGAAMRAADIEAFEFTSARDAEHGSNVALFTPAALVNTQPTFQDAWLCELTGTQVRFHALHSQTAYEFAVEQFQVAGELAWVR